MPKRVCPACREQTFVTGTSNGTTVDRCRKCRGNWFDGGELECVLDVAIKELIIGKDARQTSRYCPECTIPLQEFRYPQTNVNIEMCPTCSGLWLDHGEYRRIRDIRKRHARKDKLQEFDEVPGTKGALLNLIENTIRTLTKFD